MTLDMQLSRFTRNIPPLDASASISAARTRGVQPSAPTVDERISRRSGQWGEALASRRSGHETARSRHIEEYVRRRRQRAGEAVGGGSDQDSEEEEDELEEESNLRRTWLTTRQERARRNRVLGRSLRWEANEPLENNDEGASRFSSYSRFAPHLRDRVSIGSSHNSTAPRRMWGELAAGSSGTNNIEGASDDVSEAGRPTRHLQWLPPYAPSSDEWAVRDVPNRHPPWRNPWDRDRDADDVSRRRNRYDTMRYRENEAAAARQNTPWTPWLDDRYSIRRAAAMNQLDSDIDRQHERLQAAINRAISG